jgi:outer membrane autotransporter protein
MHADACPSRHRPRSEREGWIQASVLWGSFLPTLALAAAIAGCGAPPARAQSLNDQVVSLISGNCSALGYDPSGLPNAFGPNLSTICNAQGVPGNPAGGGAASPQGGTLSLQNNLVVQQRLERAKKNKQQDNQGSPVVSALFNGRSGGKQSETKVATDDSGSSVASSGFNIFASGTYESVDQNLSPFENSYSSSILGGAVGFDYQFNDAVVAGLVVGYREQDADYGQGGGNFEMTAVEPSVYVSVLPSPSTFLQFVAGYGSHSSDVLRNVALTIETGGTGPTFAGPAASATDANAYSGAAQFGYDHAAGRFTFGPRIGVNYNRTTIDPYTETGTTGLELRVQERTVKSLQGLVSFYGSGAFSTKSGVVIPQLNVEYVHEFEDEASIVSAQFAEDLRGPDAVTFPYQTNVPDSDFFNVGAGVGVVFAHGIQLFVNLRTMLGNSNFDSTSGTIGLRFEL